MYHIISNPTAGRKKKSSKGLKKVFDYLNTNNIEYKLYETKYKLHPTEVAKKITSENESGDIIVIGGDGTFSEVINGISNLNKWNVSLIPAGSGNDFANCLKLPKKPLLCLKQILKKELHKVDCIKVNDTICVNVLGTGIDVKVLENFEKHTKMKGSFRYFYSLVEALLHVKWHEFDVSLDDKEFVHKKGFIITLCNGSNIGGGIPICPNANPFDGKLEFVFVKEMKKIKILGCLIKLMSGKVFKMKETEHLYCKKAIFKSNENLTIQIDGNITRSSNIYSCEIINGGLNMYL